MHENEELRKQLAHSEKELVKKRHQLGRLQALEDVFNNGEFEAFQRAQLEAPQSEEEPERITPETFASQAKARGTDQWARASAKCAS